MNSFYHRSALLVLLGGAALVVSGCGGSSARYTTRGSSATRVLKDVGPLEGMASYYAEDFDGKPTASGEKYDMHAMTAAHKTLPFNTMVRVTNVENNRSVIVRINDRGPFKGDRIIDVSYSAAKQLGLILNGTARVVLDIISGDADE